MTDQSSLFDVRPSRLARRGDPETSHGAAHRLTNAETHRRRLLAVFASGEHTSEEAAAIAGLDAWQASKRTSDLINQGFLEPTGETRQGSAGRDQRVLGLTASGESALGEVGLW